jgi:hypothetical protein
MLALTAIGTLSEESRVVLEDAKDDVDEEVRRLATVVLGNLSQ